MQDVDKINFELTDELAVLRQRVAELEQSEIFYQQRQTALEEQLTELKRKLPVEAENLHNKVGHFNLPTDEAVILEQLQQEIAQRQQVEVILKESEERLRLALDVSQMVLWDWNIVSNQVIWSENYELLFGLVPSIFDSPYETFKKCVHPEDSQSVMQAIASALAEKTDYNDEFRIVRSNQSTHWISAKGKFIYDAQGQAVRMIGVCMDITDVYEEQLLETLRDRLGKLTEKECNRLLDCERTARQQTEIANKIKDEFLAVLSHELRTPLNPILGWSKMLQTRKFDQKTTNHALETIERNAKLQTHLIEDLLDVSRILEGKLNLNICPVSLVMVVEAALKTVRLAAQAKSIQIQTVFDASLGQVMGDQNRLQQVVWNLLSNAVKFTPAGGRVEIRLMEAGNQAQIQVSDTGKGISLDFLPYVFDYFRQADGTTTRTFGGLGLGLAIVRKVVEMHGGKVQTESLGEGLGATFSVELPLLVRNEQIRGEENQSSYSEPESLLLADTQILIVDDEPDIRDLITFILQDYGVQVTAVSSAQEALQALSESIPDVLISDIGMPKTDGYMLIREVRSRSPQQGGNVPAIALTAYAGEMNQQQALAAGFQMHISKPVDPDVLMKAIADLIEAS
ncbi:hybrid sensor histidine kinase/response regulator [Nostoc sp. NMS4]|uniref:ATP-binding protein n=1 Tax=Nostoc sp. NMS4 TaxID=2815390 RepID=UPI0025FE5CE9|nr:hybrid sensor histidine kinase/response regulator [Nostoc sp. NMS4]MBN3926183.1 response regulator [Nostoc sp. NMS4]